MSRPYISDCVPRAIEILVSAFVELNSLSVKFFFNDEATATHLFDRVFELATGAFAKHGGKRPEELH